MSVMRWPPSSVWRLLSTDASNLGLHHPVEEGDALHVYSDVHTGSGSSKTFPERQADAKLPEEQFAMCNGDASGWMSTLTFLYLLRTAWMYSAALAYAIVGNVVIVNCNGPP